MPRLKLVAQRPSLTRPQPPEHVSLPEMGDGQFCPAPDVMEWLRATFIDQDSILRNDDHAHLRSAHIGVLWTNVANGRRGRSIIGTCEMLPPMAMGKWAKARMMQQIQNWFHPYIPGGVPDFIITLYAPYCARADDASFCALLEHETYHAGQEQGADGPKFGQDGRPKYAIRGHDIEEFTGVVRRYGAKAAQADVFVTAATQGPQISQAEMDWACGSCQMKAAA